MPRPWLMGRSWIWPQVGTDVDVGVGDVSVEFLWDWLVINCFLHNNF